MAKPDPEYLNQIRYIIDFQMLSDLKDVNEFISNIGEIAKIRNKGVIPIMEKIYCRKNKWNQMDYFDKAVCLDFLIDKDRHHPKEKEQDEGKVKAMIKELTDIAKENVATNDLIDDPIGIVVIKRCLVEPGEYNPPKFGFYTQFTEELLSQTPWGRTITPKITYFKKGLKFLKDFEAEE